MKKFIAITAISLLVWSCGHKMTPAGNAEKPAGNSNTGYNTPVDKPAGSTTTTTTAAATSANAATTTGARTSTTTSTDPAVLGMGIYNAKCGRCHGLKVVSDYTSDRWVSIMQVMARKANLSDTEKEQVLAYVQANAKKG
jgi:hypothetical protein